MGEYNREDFTTDNGYIVVTWDAAAGSWRFRPVVGGAPLGASDLVALGLNAPMLPEAPWTYPVGSVKFPIAQWYCAQYHKPGVHTGLDLNVQVWPRGGIDEGEPVTAITSGVVTSLGYSPQPSPGRGWLACVVIRVEQAGYPLWVRYAHLLRESIPVGVGYRVTVGQQLGVLDAYYNAAGHNAAHLHFDMARDPFEWNWWLTGGIEWVDPVPVLKAELDPAMVDAMLGVE